MSLVKIGENGDYVEDGFVEVDECYYCGYNYIVNDGCECENEQEEWVWIFNRWDFMKIK